MEIRISLANVAALSRIFEEALPSYRYCAEHGFCFAELESLRYDHLVSELQELIKELKRVASSTSTDGDTSIELVTTLKVRLHEHYVRFATGTQISETYNALDDSRAPQQLLAALQSLRKWFENVAELKHISDKFPQLGNSPAWNYDIMTYRHSSHYRQLEISHETGFHRPAPAFSEYQLVGRHSDHHAIVVIGSPNIWGLNSYFSSFRLTREEFLHDLQIAEAPELETQLVLPRPNTEAYRTMLRNAAKSPSHALPRLESNRGPTSGQRTRTAGRKPVKGHLGKQRSFHRTRG